MLQSALVAVYRDTMTITKFYITEQIILQGEGLPGDRIAGTRCDAVVRLGAHVWAIMHSKPHRYFKVRHFPDPAYDELTLQVNLEAQTLTVTIYSMLGTAVASLPAQTMERGAWDIALKLKQLETGFITAKFGRIRSRTPQGNGRWTGLVRVALGDGFLLSQGTIYSGHYFCKLRVRACKISNS